MNSLALYFTAFSLSSAIASLEKSRVKSKHLHYLFVLVLPVTVATLRDGIGTDYTSYYLYYRDIASGVDRTDMEPLFKVLNYVAYYVFNRYRGVLFLSACITYSFVLSALSRALSGVELGIGMWIFYCFYFSASLNTMRQLIALSIALYACVRLWEGSYRLFLIFLTLASLFHLSAVILFPMLLVRMALNKEKGIIIIISVILSVSVLIGLIGRGIVKIIPLSLLEKYGKYFKTEGQRSITLEYVLDILPPFLMVALPAALYFLLCRRKDNYEFFFLMGLSVMPVLTLGYSIDYFQRLAYYLDSSQTVLLPICAQALREPRLRWLCRVGAVLIYGVYFIYSSVYQGSNEIFPYFP